MAIDIRATVTCSLGTLISANVSDDYIQGSGLIKTRGTCEISGLVNPAVGQVVTFNYTKSGLTRSVPRKLRVLSSFADPFRRTTKVELGCKLTYLSDLRERLNWAALDDPENAELDEVDTSIITVPISARSIANECLSKLGISASSNPLTNKFSIAQFDFSAGYVQVLSDLLVSESYCGYLDYTERLQVFSLQGTSNDGPIITQQKLIDIGPIGVGDMPGDAVTVSYSTLKLKVSDGTAVAEREEDEEEEDKITQLVPIGGNDPTQRANTSSVSKVIVPYSQTLEDGSTISRTAVYSVSNYSQETVTYGKVTTPQGTQNVVRRRVMSERSSAVSVAGGIASQYLTNGFTFGNSNVESSTTELFEYNSDGNETFRSLVRRGDALFGAGALGVSWVVAQEDGGVAAVPLPTGLMLLEEVTVETYTNGDYRRTVTRRYGPWIYTIAGQQAVAEGRETLTTVSDITGFINTALEGRHLLDVTVSTERSGQGAGSQEAPSTEDQINESLADSNTADPTKEYRTDSVGEIVLATGSPLAERRIELSMPYAPDDTFTKVLTDINPDVYTYYARSSDAKTKAMTYGRTQNRILLGNRSGMNIQVEPERLPNAPFGAYYVSANGVVTQYRTNGTSWTMDSSGIVASTDGLYWGVAGKAS